MIFLICCGKSAGPVRKKLEKAGTHWQLHLVQVPSCAHATPRMTTSVSLSSSHCMGPSFFGRRVIIPSAKLICPTLDPHVLRVHMRGYCNSRVKGLNQQPTFTAARSISGDSQRAVSSQGASPWHETWHAASFARNQQSHHDYIYNYIHSTISLYT